MHSIQSHTLSRVNTAFLHSKLAYIKLACKSTHSHNSQLKFKTQTQKRKNYLLVTVEREGEEENKRFKSSLVIHLPVVVR